MSQVIMTKKHRVIRAIFGHKTTHNSLPLTRLQKSKDVEIVRAEILQINSVILLNVNRLCGGCINHDV